jgi:cytochrome c553
VNRPRPWLIAACLLASWPAAAGVAGVDNPRRAWQHWVLNCQGCHGPDAAGRPNATPNMAGEVAQFLGTPEGRAYLGRVPGVADAPLSDAALAELMNWMLVRFDPDNMPADFRPYTAQEIKKLRSQPLRTDASRTRAALLGATGSTARDTNRGEP